MAKHSALGLAITDNLIELLELTADKGTVAVSSYGFLKLTPDLIRGGRVLNPKALAEELKRLVQAAGLKIGQRPVVLGLSQSQVFLKVFTIPKFEAKELEEAIGWHVASLGPVLPQEAYTSYEVIAKKDEAVKILLLAAAKTVIDGYLEALDLAGIEVQAIEPLAAAAGRLVSPKQLLNKSVLYAHLYRNRLSSSILVNAKLWFSKESWVETGKENQVAQSLTELIKYFSERKEADMAELSEVVYSGDDPGVEILNKSLVGLKLQVVRGETGSVLASEGGVRDLSQLRWAPVLGLAMRGGWQQKGLVNLLPEWPQEKKQLKCLAQRLSLSLVILGAAVWLTVGLLELGWWWLGQERRRLIKQQEQLQLVQQEAAANLNWGRDFNETVAKIELIEASRLNYSQILSNLANLMPRSVKLTAMSYTSQLNKWSIAGVAQQRDDVLLLDKNLKESSWFKNSRLYFSSLESGAGEIFRFSGGEDGK